ncbi:MAG: bifunctional glycosyltransferase family 2/GtrA family protein [Kiritimatiellae bacterium]|nr:bifunctional glycosyltransferase family 2/GtrA family protein [Kiritimatiellia bacterium]
MNENAIVLIPAYNPDEKLVGLVDALRKAFKTIVVVNDGSTKGVENFSKVAALGATLLAHEKNRGKGAALKTGIAHISSTRSANTNYVVVTADSDGQHTPSDIAKVAEAALTHPDGLTLGVRAFSGKVPFRSRFGNWWTRQFFFLMTHLRVQDTQTGLRGIPSCLLERMLAIEGERYEYEMRMLADAKRHAAPPLQVPIETVYIAQNASSHFNPLKDSIRIYGALLHFCASSVGCFLLDNAIFTAIVFAAAKHTGLKRATYTALAICAARTFSATANYFYNRYFVFHSQSSKCVSFAKYWVLVVVILALGWGCTAVLSRIFDAFGWTITFIKIAVETALFFLSYNVQKKWIFK